MLDLHCGTRLVSGPIIRLHFQFCNFSFIPMNFMPRHFHLSLPSEQTYNLQTNVFIPCYPIAGHISYACLLLQAPSLPPEVGHRGEPLYEQKYSLIVPALKKKKKSHGILYVMAGSHECSQEGP